MNIDMSEFESKMKEWETEAEKLVSTVNHLQRKFPFIDIDVNISVDEEKLKECYTMRMANGKYIYTEK